MSGKEVVGDGSPTGAAYRVLLAWERLKLSFTETIYRALGLGDGRNCTGSRSCEARLHYHGCFADFGNCDAPEEHRRG